MKRRLAITLMLSFSLLVACSGEETTAPVKNEEKPVEVITPEQPLEKSELQNVLEALLTSDMEGRLPGTKGNELAGEYIQSKFNELGLVPVMGENLAVPFNYEYYDSEKLKHQLIIKSASNEVVELVRGKDYFERTTYVNYNETFPFTTNLGDKDLAKSYFIMDSENNLSILYGRAKGYLFRDENFIKNAISYEVDQPIIQITDEIYNKLKVMKTGTIQLSMTGEAEQKELVNIVGKLPGEQSSNAVVISAHYDHVGSLNNNALTGAVDNGAAVALLMDIANKLAESGAIFSRDIIFAAFNAEESEQAGSKAFVEQLAETYENVYNINLDYLSNKPLIVSANELLTSNLMVDLEQVLKAHGLTYKVDNKSVRKGDHLSFLANNYNAISLATENAFLNVTQPANASSMINYEYLEEVAAALVDFLISKDSEVYAYELSE